MPDLLLIIEKRWKFIAGLTFLATLLGFLAVLISPREYLSTATALPANSVIADKARIFNNNIDALYSDFGSPDELDRMEGTAVLDTLFIAVAQELDLSNHYKINTGKDHLYKAALRLKKNSTVSRSAYGELKVKAWDKDPIFASVIANTLMQKLQALHQHLQNESNSIILQKIKEDLAEKQKEFLQLLNDSTGNTKSDTLNIPQNRELVQIRLAALREQLKQNENLVSQYQFAFNTNPQVLLLVENARPSLKPDKPKILPTVLLVFFSALLCSFLIAVYMESKKMA